MTFHLIAKNNVPNNKRLRKPSLKPVVLSKSDGNKPWFRAYGLRLWSPSTVWMSISPKYIKLENFI